MTTLVGALVFQILVLFCFCLGWDFLAYGGCKYVYHVFHNLLIAFFTLLHFFDSILHYELCFVSFMQPIVHYVNIVQYAVLKVLKQNSITSANLVK